MALNRKLVLQRPYISSTPILKVTFIVRDNSGLGHDFTEDFMVDTGFNGGLKLSKNYIRILERLGIEGIDSVALLADGTRVLTSIFDAEIAEISSITNYRLSPPVPTKLSCFGLPPFLIGRQFLDKWIAEFDGPKQVLSLLSYDINR
ncbi:MAG: hypothetical protein QXD42_03990 [Nitrososphaerales archaeon]